MVRPVARSATTTENPGNDFRWESPVINSDVVPGVISIVVLKSSYPSRIRTTLWLPGDNPGITAGVIPFIWSSIYTRAPDGAVVMERIPVVGIVVGCGDWVVVVAVVPVPGGVVDPGELVVTGVAA